jgi:tellurium resistance protein TerZ
VTSVIELTAGQELVLTGDDERPLTRLLLGLGWDKERTAGAIGSGAPDVDLDASAVQFAGDQLFDLAFYNNLQTRDGSVVHLGDNQTGRGDGDDEVITVDLTRVYAKVDTIVFMVSSYQGHTLEWINRAYVRLAVAGDEGDDVELARFTLTGGVPKTGMAMAKLFRDGADEGRWRLRAIGEGIAAKIPTESVAALRPFL